MSMAIMLFSIIGKKETNKQKNVQTTQMISKDLSGIAGTSKVGNTRKSLTFPGKYILITQ